MYTYVCIYIYIYKYYNSVIDAEDKKHRIDMYT